MPTEKCCGTCNLFFVSYYDPYRGIDCGRCESKSLEMAESFVKENRQLIAASVEVTARPISAEDGENCPCWESGNNIWRGPHIGPPAHVMPIPTATGEVKIMPLRKEG